MTNTNVNIFDLMLGNPSATVNNQFGLIEPTKQKDVQGGESTEPSFDMVFGNMLQSVAPELLGSGQVNQQVMPQQMETAESNNLLGLVSEDDMMGQAEVAENVKMFNKELQEMMPQNKSTQNINIKEILAQQNVELENGQYKVLSKEIVDSKVALTIEGTNGKQLTVTLPIDSMQNNSLNGTQDRVAIQDSSYLKKLESMIEKVDIQSIEIKSSEAKLSQNVLKPVEISLVGEQNSTVLKASLKQNQIKINELQTTTSHPKAAVLDESGLFDEVQTLKPQLNNGLIEKVNVDANGRFVNNVSKANQQLSLNGEALNQSNEQIMTSFNAIGTDSAENIEVKEDVKHVRMQLPENIKSVLRPNSQAVVIKMNPENLGPAKLSLSFHGGKLRAKLMVTSVNAKQALDSSMSKLVDQLQKIDINVDKIDVTLDGQQNQNEQYQQKQQWQRKMSFKNIDLNQFERNEIEKVQQPVKSSAQTLSTGSVNYLA